MSTFCSSWIVRALGGDQTKTHANLQTTQSLRGRFEAIVDPTTTNESQPSRKPQIEERGRKQAAVNSKNFDPGSHLELFSWRAAWRA